MLQKFGFGREGKEGERSLTFSIDPTYNDMTYKFTSTNNNNNSDDVIATSDSKKRTRTKDIKNELKQQKQRSIAS